jgi:hypothetical protein
MRKSYLDKFLKSFSQKELLVILSDCSNEELFDLYYSSKELRKSTIEYYIRRNDEKKMKNDEKKMPKFQMIK